MALSDFVYARTGIRINVDSAGADQDSQLLVTTLLVLVANSDGGISPDESIRMVEMLRSRFGIKPGEALDLINRASDELAHHTELEDILKTAAGELSLAHTEDLMLMVLHVISADNRKDAAEMKLLAALIEGLGVSDKTMGRAYERYFADQ